MLTRSPIQPKPGKCRHCKGRLEKIGERIHIACVSDWLAANQSKIKAKAALAVKKQDRERRKALETIPELIAAADRAFASFIRERDRKAGYPCISSGQPLDWSGNETDCGHWRSRGAASHLRYSEDNAHAQRKYDNRYLSGNAAAYRVGLIARIGLERVEALENNNTPHKWEKDELRAIASKYRALARALEKERKEG